MQAGGWLCYYFYFKCVGRGRGKLRGVFIIAFPLHPCASSLLHCRLLLSLPACLPGSLYTTFPSRAQICSHTSWTCSLVSQWCPCRRHVTHGLLPPLRSLNSLLVCLLYVMPGGSVFELSFKVTEIIPPKICKALLAFTKVI